MIFTGNPLIIKPGMVFFMHMILMDSKAQLAMNLGETYLVTKDGMTADFFPFKKDFAQKVSNKIINTVNGINRVVYDITLVWH